MGAWQNASVDLDNATFHYYDGTSYYSVSCQLYVTNNTGGVYSSSTRYSCAADTTNGCAAASGGHMGYGSITWTAGTLPNGGSAVSNVGPYGYFCGLPSRANYDLIEAKVITQNYSKLMSYVVDQVNP